MVKKMGGNRREWDYPVMRDNDETAMSDKDKEGMMGKAFVNIDSSDNLSKEGKRDRDQRMREYLGAL